MENKDKPFELIAITNDFSEIRNFNANVRIIELYAKDKTCAIKTIFGFEINKSTFRGIKQELGINLKKSPFFDHDFEIQYYKHWFYFKFDVNDILIKVAQSPIKNE